MKIYDCFIFFNENLLTEIRLNLLDDYVDYFVICESQYDHRGNFKGYLFNQKKFTKFEKKIIYLKIDSFPQNIGAWERQDFQRDYLENGLLNADKDDLIIYSDADEIINPRIISKMNNLESNVGICDQLCFYYKLNLLSNQYRNNWEGSRFVKFRYLKNFSWLRSVSKKNLRYRFYRIDKFKKIIVYKNGGWHFSYLMSEVDMQKKIKAWTHSELDTQENNQIQTIQKRVKKNLDLFGRKIEYTKLNFDKKNFPKYLLTNKKKYKDWII